MKKNKVINCQRLLDTNTMSFYLDKINIMSYYKKIMNIMWDNVIKGRICNSCKSEIQRSELDKNYLICPRCGYHMRMHARKHGVCSWREGYSVV